MRRLKEYILLYGKGVGMGAVEIIPGVSAGTVAIITGIYLELIRSINAINREAFILLKKHEWAAFWQAINGNFFVVLLTGFATSFILLNSLISFLLKSYPILLWSFFFGLIMISAPLAMRGIKWSLGTILSLIIGISIAYFITTISPIQTPNSLWFIFLCGVLASCALVLPGISSVFILMLFHKYQYVINAAVNHHNVVFLVFLLGALGGLIGFSRFLGWIIENYHSTTVALLTGFMIGALNKVWPWREVLEFATTLKGEQIPAFDRSILPWHYFTITGKDPQVFQAILMMALGVFIVVLIEKIAVRLKTRF